MERRSPHFIASDVQMSLEKVCGCSDDVREWEQLTPSCMAGLRQKLGRNVFRSGLPPPRSIPPPPCALRHQATLRSLVQRLRDFLPVLKVSNARTAT
ncbi:hypothetical protein QE152_g28366 [Popillia japonica]|uniref:Uncharacterized protein n=1 Tax=Popillia japonica TaxID=7064 RepID=A0AAW1JJR4_POPJA